MNGKQHSVWFVPAGMKGLPQNVLLRFRLEFPKSDLTIYLPSGISEIFFQIVSTPGCDRDISVVTFSLLCFMFTGQPGLLVEISTLANRNSASSYIKECMTMT